MKPGSGRFGLSPKVRLDPSKFVQGFFRARAQVGSLWRSKTIVGSVYLWKIVKQNAAVFEIFGGAFGVVVGMKANDDH